MTTTAGSSNKTQSSNPRIILAIVLAFKLYYIKVSEAAAIVFKIYY